MIHEMMAQRLMYLKMKGVDHTMQLMGDTSLHIEDFLESNGLLPRDGGLRYALDENDCVISNQRISEVPETLYLGLPKQILSVWVEKTTKHGVQTKTILDDRSELYVPGLKPDEHYHIFVSRQSKSQQGVNRQHGYRFRTDGEAYLNGDHVYVRIPRNGENVKIFDPKTGLASKQLRVDTGNTPIDEIRGLWCVCTFHPGVNGNSEWLLYQPDLTYVPPGFKPAKKRMKRSRKPFGVKNEGFVKWFDWNKGFGFISRDNGSDVFFHKSNTSGYIKQGIKVQFEIEFTDKGPNAIKVSKIKKGG